MPPFFSAAEAIPKTARIDPRRFPPLRLVGSGAAASLLLDLFLFFDFDFLRLNQPFFFFFLGPSSGRSSASVTHPSSSSFGGEGSEGFSFE